ncbi:MAG: ribonuclease R [Bacteroidales bacterium]|jgi:ribonuclease R|nr:ribonuclease R [Bacteroidales bacterium]
MATSKRKTTKTRKNTNKSGEGALKRAKRIARGLQEPVRTTERRSKSLEEFEGTVSLSRDGFGFVKVEGLQDDVFVPMRKLHFALNGDFVKIAVSKRRMQAGMKGRSLEGEVVKIIRRSTKPHIGILVVRGRQVWAIVESKYMPYDIRIDVNGPDDLPEIGGLKAAHGMKVAVLVTDWPKRSVEPVGRIVDVLGVPGENDTEMHAILAEFQLPYRFEPEVEQAAEKISDAITPKDLAGRRDFRGVTTFTIDPADAKDFDDALSFRELENGHLEVGIHIADVTHYVTPGSPIDKEAFARGTSVYLVDRTIPMLPEKLSNNLCSLRPKEDKLTFSAVFEMNDKAKVIGQWFGRTVINSDYRFDYEQAQQIIETGEGPLAPEIARLHALASILRKERFAKGAISFERPEMKVIVDETGKPVDVVQKESKESNWLIEEFMLLANRCVAEYATKKCKAKNPTFVYRIHENPDPEKLDSLRNFAKNFGHTLGDTSNPKTAAGALNDLMKEAKGKPEENALQLLALRSMARARYSTDNVGHYGLAFQFYTHFTSPIRRYPDMMVHRLLAMYMDGATSQDKLYYEDCCEHSSVREQIATDAERASIKYKMVEYMQDKIGRLFEGHVSGLTEWGIYVEVEPTKIEGMVALRDVHFDWFEFDEEKYETRGKASGRVFHLGDPVKVRVLRANLEQKILDYELVEE